MRILLQNKYYPIVSCPSPTQSYSCWWDDDRDCNLCDILPLPSFLECTMFVFRIFFSDSIFIRSQFSSSYQQFLDQTMLFFRNLSLIQEVENAKVVISKIQYFLFIYCSLQFLDQVLKLLIIFVFKRWSHLFFCWWFVMVGGI